eukprot:CAMPEP_0180697756 /NCGR_PEP_ID=MMETSP1038_2-20121128/3665_1 /TAXON_ID=632150 /ORGANISM="Azadinium spinosum, Strain 3D9" /LENGTH=346 /DNA_ID=CAMNT_0022729289 /DNA_START=69 /DNA_END=1111 /DNA_ORIENTATION=-
MVVGAEIGTVETGALGAETALAGTKATTAEEATTRTMAEAAMTGTRAVTAETATAGILVTTVKISAAGMVTGVMEPGVAESGTAESGTAAGPVAAGGRETTCVVAMMRESSIGEAVTVVAEQARESREERGREERSREERSRSPVRRLASAPGSGQAAPRSGGDGQGRSRPQVQPPPPPPKRPLPSRRDDTPPRPPAGARTRSRGSSRGSPDRRAPSASPGREVTAPTARGELAAREGEAGEEAKAYWDASVVDGVPRSDKRPTWRAEINVPRPGAARAGSRTLGAVCIRGPNRFKEEEADEDLQELKDAAVKAGDDNAAKEVRKVASEQKHSFERQKHLDSGHAN